jgi:uncharacterized RDD family membrane protein YckC
VHDEAAVKVNFAASGSSVWHEAIRGRRILENARKMQIYVTRNDQRIGPFSLEEVNRQLAAGLLHPANQAWHEGSPGWKPLASIVGVLVPGAASSTFAPIGVAAVAPTRSTSYAGFWIRFLSLATDCAILAIPVAVVLVSFWLMPNESSANRLVSAAFLIALLKILYFAGLWSSYMQATLGQKLCGLCVVRATDQSRISFWRGLGRLLGMVLSSLVLFIGYIMIPFTERKQALHDILAGTCVITTRYLSAWNRL